MQTKTKNFATKNLAELLAETEALSEASRNFWLRNLDQLDANSQKELVKIISTGERELQKERENHANRIAEIEMKCSSNLKTFASAQGLQGDDEDDENLNFDEDEILKTLQQAGEI